MSVKMYIFWRVFIYVSQVFNVYVSNKWFVCVILGTLLNLHVKDTILLNQDILYTSQAYFGAKEQAHIMTKSMGQ